MDGLIVTCRTCGIKTSFEDVGNHVCRTNPPANITTRYEVGPRHLQEVAPRQSPPIRSDVGMASNIGAYANLLGRNPYSTGTPVPNYQESSPSQPIDDLSLGPQFDIKSLRAPHSYGHGPYGAISQRPESRNGAGARPLPPHQFGSRPPPPRNPHQDTAYEVPRQQGPSRPQYVEDFDYGRSKLSIPQRNGAPHRDARITPNHGYAEPDDRINGNPYDRPHTFNDLRDRNADGAQYRRMSPEHRYPDQKPDPLYQTSADLEKIETREGRPQNFEFRPGRSPQTDTPLATSKPTSSSPGDSLDPVAEEVEFWRQIRARARQNSRSPSSSRSSDSSTIRSRRSETTVTPPSSAASPISPAKITETAPLNLRKVGANLAKITNSKIDSRDSTRVSLPECRACGETIRGRSLASQDGKLTGRYHKHCFCCTSCRKPFETASFYVLMDRPYCKQHYHELNHSICGSCSEGVEGECLQLEDNTICHPSCFRCSVFPPSPLPSFS